MKKETDVQLGEEALKLKDRLPLLQAWAESRCLSGRTTERAFIVEFGGMPKAGKSSVIQTLRHFFSHGTKLIVGVPGEWETKFREGYVVCTPAEGVSLRTPNFLKPNLWDFNAWAGAYALQELLQARHDRHHDLVILDRGPWDASCWLEYVQENRSEDVHLPDDANKIVDFFSLPYWATLSDLHVVLTVDPESARARETQQRLIEHGGPASNIDLMSKMRTIYENRFKILESAKSGHCGAGTVAASCLIETTDMHPKRVALDIIRATLDLVEAKLGNMPSRKPISLEELRELLSPFLANATGQLRHEFDSYAPEFCKRAGVLPERRRQSVREQIRDMAGGVQAMLNRSDSPGELRSSLEQIISEAETE